MKRILCLILAFALMIPIFGCSSPSFDPVMFYYCRRPDDYQYFQKDGVIASEGRDLSGHSDDLQYLVALYLAGPLDETMTSPFPRKTRLVAVEKTDRSVQIELTDLGSTMSDSEFSLAAVCLAKTCIPFAGVSEASIRSGARTITINAENVFLYDNTITDSTEGE